MTTTNTTWGWSSVGGAIVGGFPTEDMAMANARWESAPWADGDHWVTIFIGRVVMTQDNPKEYLREYAWVGTPESTEVEVGDWTED